MTATATSNYTIQGGTGAPTVWVRKSPDGTIITHEQTQDERMAHVVPPAGEYTLKIISFAEPFEMTGEYGTSTNTRLECQIVGGKGDGKVCTLLLTWIIGPKSNFGKVFRAVTGRAVDKGGEYDVTDILGGQFKALLYPSDKVYGPESPNAGQPTGTKCTWESVKGVGETADSADADDWN